GRRASVKSGIEVKDLKKQGYTQAGVWSKKFSVFRFGSSEVVVVQQEDGHHKGNKLCKKCCAIYSNIPREICKIFTDTCPIGTQETNRKKPTAGVRNIITEGFGVRGQVDLIDFQSTPDGPFKYLLNYIDHGVKKL
ncbi:hypothetical protein ACHAWO_006298, partial [Cyclotella atomus]